MSALRAGLIGFGAMGRCHARILDGLPGVELAGIVDPAGEPPVLRSLDELLARDLDYAVVACPASAHTGVGIRLAEAGVAALIEKPLAPSSEAAVRLARAFSERGLVAGVGHVERYGAAVRGLRARLEAGDLGELFQIGTRRQGPYPHRIMDVGVVPDLATHDIDLAAWVTGRSYASVSARAPGYRPDDLIAIVGELAGGIVASHLVDRLSPVKHRSTVVTGERGCLVADTLRTRLVFHPYGGGDAVQQPLVNREPLLAEHECFRDAVLGDPGGIVPLHEGVRTVEVAEAVQESARTGMTMPVLSTGGGSLGEGAGNGKEALHVA